MILSSTRPLAALGIATVVFGTLALYTVSVQKPILREADNYHDEIKMVAIDLTVATTGRLGGDAFALAKPNAIKITLDGQLVHERAALDSGLSIAIQSSLRADVDHRLLVEAIPESDQAGAVAPTAIRIALTHGAHPVAERVGWSENGETISEEILFRVTSGESASHAH